MLLFSHFVFDQFFLTKFVNKYLNVGLFICKALNLRYRELMHSTVQYITNLAPMSKSGVGLILLPILARDADVELLSRVLSFFFTSIHSD